MGFCVPQTSQIYLKPSKTSTLEKQEFVGDCALSLCTTVAYTVESSPHSATAIQVSRKHKSPF